MTSRRLSLQLLSAGLLGALTGTPTRAGPPTHLRMLIPANAGGGWDRTGREFGQALLRSGLIHGVQYDNRGGAAGTIGLAQFAAQYKGNPQAMMVMGSVMLGGIITGKPPVGLDRVRPLARLTNEYNVFVLPPGSPFRDMREVMAQFRANPVSIKWGGGSRGSTEHIAVHMLARLLGVPARAINYVPFRGGGEAAAAIMGGHVTVGGSGYSEFLAPIRAGRMVPVAITAPQRIAGLEVPTLLELGWPVDIGNWRGLCAPAGLTQDQYSTLVRLVEQGIASDAWVEAVRRQGWLSEPLLGDAFARFIRQEFDAMHHILVRAGLA